MQARATRQNSQTARCFAHSLTTTRVSTTRAGKIITVETAGGAEVIGVNDLPEQTSACSAVSNARAHWLHLMIPASFPTGATLHRTGPSFSCPMGTTPEGGRAASAEYLLSNIRAAFPTNPGRTLDLLLRFLHDRL